MQPYTSREQEVWISSKCPYCGYDAPLKMLATVDSSGMFLAWRVASVNDRICQECEAPIPNPGNQTQS